MGWGNGSGAYIAEVYASVHSQPVDEKNYCKSKRHLPSSKVNPLLTTT